MASDAAAWAAWSASASGGHADGEGANREGAGDGALADDGGGDEAGAEAGADLPIEEAPAERPSDVEDPDQTPVGPLMGGYRPSSLRLIDEAVAAAQAIEPSLFDDSRNGSQASAVHGHRSNGVSHAAHAADDHYAHDSTEGAIAAAEAARQGHEANVNLRAAEREDSGLRMIGSLGRDRAEASGELAAFGHSRPLRSETARELVTILPRRITRELPIITQELAESLPTPTPTASVLVARPMPALDLGEPTQRVALPGSGVRAASRSRRLLRIMRPVDGGGPGVVAMLLIILAVALAGTAGLLRLRRHTTTVPPPAQLDGVRDAPAAAGSRPPGSSNEPSGSAGDRSPTDGDDRTGSARPSSDDPGDGRGGSGTIGSAGAVAPGGGGPGGAWTASAAGSAGAPARAGVAAAGSAKVADGAAVVSGDISRAAAGTPTGTSGGAPRTAVEHSIERSGPGRSGGTAASGAAAGRSSAGARDATGRSSDGASDGAGAPTGSARDGAGAATGRASDPAAPPRRSGASAPGSPRVAEAGSSAGTSAPAAKGNGAAGATAANAGSAAGAGGAARGTPAGGASAEAKALGDQASNALDEGDFARALQLAQSSIKLRKTARAYMLRARAEQRLGRVDDALSSLDAATELAPSSGAVWEQRGRILWAARRRDEARAAFQRFLELAPSAASAPEILRLLNEPR
jgi:Flp pilus assembly protein TadD